MRIGFSGPRIGPIRPYASIRVVPRRSWSVDC